MIKKVEIENFQSHKKTILEFVPGTNVIIGESDAGKSAIFRAINWVITNRPLGDGFRSDWGGDTRVAIYTAEGDVIERIKTATKNVYVVNGKALTAFGSDVPQQVNEILQMDEANIQSQMDVPFLLAVSPGEAARLLNKAASIDDIDYTLSNLRGEYQKISNNIKFNEGKLKDYETQIKQYDNLPELEEKLERVEEAEKELEKHEQKLAKLTQLVAGVIRIHTELEKTKNIQQIAQKFEQILSRYNDYEEQRKRLDKLEQVAHKVKIRKAYLRSIQYIDECFTSIQKTYEEYQKYQTKQQTLAKLKRLIRSVIALNQSIQRIEREISLLEKKFRKLCPEECPLCGAKIKK
jgi:exonuclease SbcC